MKVDVLAALGAQLTRGGGSVSFADDGELGARLTLGQIIKGRVLRSEDGGRHLVDFGGRQRIVDSTVPLRPGEVFRGRVVGLGEQVQLQKLSAEADETAEAPPPASPSLPRLGSGETLSALFERYRAQVPQAQLEAAASTVARAPQPQTAALAALVLAKLGLPLEPGWIRSLQARLAGTDRGEPDRAALRMETAVAQSSQPEGASLLEAAVPALAAALSGQMNDRLTARADHGPDDGSRRPPRDAPAWILNLQTRGTVAHRLGCLPLVVDGRLIELDVALFDERPSPQDMVRPGGRDAGQDAGAAPADAMRHRQIVIAIETGTLGRVEVRARMVGTRMDVSIATASSEQTLALSQHSARLNDDLSGLGWQVDALQYSTRQVDAGSGALHTVVEHIINPGSVSRLV